MNPYPDNLFVQIKDFVVQNKWASIFIVGSTTSYYIIMSSLQKLGIIDAMCSFKNLTGLPCPGCGMTRACLCLMRLDFAGAIYYNPFSYLVIGGLAFVSMNESVELIFRKKISYGWLVRHKKIILTCLIILLVANWMWSIAKGI